MSNLIQRIFQILYFHDIKGISGMIAKLNHTDVNENPQKVDMDGISRKGLKVNNVILDW